jgi:hypothetical protein
VGDAILRGGLPIFPNRHNIHARSFESILGS